jgi:hypothetical protein
MVIVYPVLKKMCSDYVSAHIRPHKEDAKPEVVVNPSVRRLSDTDMKLDTDNFTEEETYDIRFQRVIRRARSLSRSFEDTLRASESREASTIGEINVVFKGKYWCTNVTN